MENGQLGSGKNERAGRAIVDFEMFVVKVFFAFLGRAMRSRLVVRVAKTVRLASRKGRDESRQKEPRGPTIRCEKGFFHAILFKNKVLKTSKVAAF